MRIALYVLFCPLVLALCACGGDDSSSGDGDGGQPAVKTLEREKDDPAKTGDSGAGGDGTPNTSIVSKEEVKRQAVIKRLGERLASSRDSDDRAEVLAAIAEMGKDAVVLRKEVIAVLDDEEAMTRTFAVEALARIDPRGSRQHLEKALKDDEGEVRAKAAEMFSVSGATDFRPLLVAIEDDIDHRVQLAAMKVLEEKGSHFLAPQIAEALGGLDGPAARSAVRFLVKHKAHVGKGVDRIADLLSRDGATLRKEAAEALETIGTKNKAVVSALVHALSDEESSVMLAANKTLVALTGKDLGLKGSQTPEERKLRINSWKQWLKANEASLGG